MNQSELIGAFSHEIRNPLTLINSSLQLLETDCPAVLDCALWPQIRRDIQDLLRLLNDMSSLTKSNRIIQTFLSVSCLFSSVDASIRPMMEEKDIRFTLSMEPSLSDVNLYADLSKLKEALINLLLNAMDAVAELKEDREILLFAEYDTHNKADVLIHVRDNGPGIPSNYMETLFEPFVTHKPHGTGLGLGIVQNIIAQHGGSVRVNTCSTAPNSYTDFCLVLPAFRQMD